VAIRRLYLLSKFKKRVKSWHYALIFFVLWYFAADISSEKSELPLKRTSSKRQPAIDQITQLFLAAIMKIHFPGKPKLSVGHTCINQFSLFS
jgi:hypothetical protein